MNGDMVRVSVVMAVYNGDETPAPDILTEYAARDARIIALRNERNLGPYPSANRALDIARFHPPYISC